MKTIKVVGGGLAGSEAAYQLLKRGYAVNLYEMRPLTTSPAHKTSNLAELVCSNSLKSTDEETASGLLKAEMRVFDSLIIKCADAARVEAGGALAVDREKFSAAVEAELNKFPKFKLIRKEIKTISDDEPIIYATGPLTSAALSDSIKKFAGEELHFFDAVAPIIDAESIDKSIAFFGGRYGKGGADYLNCPMKRDEYERFYNALITAQTVQLHEFDKTEIFQGCMPIEVMAKRGSDTIRFGPLKPVGIFGQNGEKYYAIVQLRKETDEGSAYNIVGFQTNLTFPEQRRVFRLIPALENAEFLRYGVMHRNTYLNSPKLLTSTFKLKGFNNVYFAGQITGVEGYVESAMSGLLAAIHLDRHIKGLLEKVPPVTTIMGALSNYISSCPDKFFAPMNANFGILPVLSVKDKKTRKKEYYIRGYRAIMEYNQSLIREDFLNGI